MTRIRREPTLIVPLAGLAPLVAAAAMVAVRGEVEPEITVLVLALTVALGARLGGRPAGVLAAVIAALSFDFFHTRPYLSLTISDPEDILSTVLLLAVALVVGGLSARATAEQQELRTMRDDGAAVRRVLLIAVTGDPEDVELAVRAELSTLLVLRECRYAPDSGGLPLLGPNGELPDAQLRYQPEGFELPVAGFAIRVQRAGRTLGYLLCHPVAGVGIHVANRRSAVALSEILALSLRPAEHQSN
jgi:uncharacterized protein DUF4118